MIPGAYSDFIGVILLVVVIAIQYVISRKKKTNTPAAA